MSTSELPAPSTEVLGTPLSPEVEEHARRAARSRRDHGRDAGRSGSPAPRGVKASRPEELIVGGAPIAHLLPSEVLAQDKARTTRNVVLYLLAGVLVLAGIGVTGSYLFAQGEQGRLEAIQAQSASVLAQETKYAPARAAQNRVQLAQAAQRVGAASEIDWNGYFGAIQSLLPAGVSVTAISGETASPTTTVAQGTAPLSASRSAIVSLTVVAPDETAIANALDALQKLPGYAGAFLGTITQSTPDQSAKGSTSSASSQWTAPITISLTDAAFANRFAPKSK